MMNISKDDAINIIVNFIYGDKLYPGRKASPFQGGEEVRIAYFNHID